MLCIRYCRPLKLPLMAIIHQDRVVSHQAWFTDEEPVGFLRIMPLLFSADNAPIVFHPQYQIALRVKQGARASVTAAESPGVGSRRAC